MMKGQQEPSVPLPGQSRSHRCGTCEGKVKGVKKEEMGFWRGEKPKMLIWLSSSGFSDLENLQLELEVPVIRMRAAGSRSLFYCGTWR